MSHPISLSLRARGLSLLTPESPKTAGLGFFKEFIDLGAALLINCALLSPFSWFTVIIALLSAVFFSAYAGGVISLDASLFTPFAFLVFLPALYMAASAFQRREQAHAALSRGACPVRVPGVRAWCMCANPPTHAYAVCIWVRVGVGGLQPGCDLPTLPAHTTYTHSPMQSNPPWRCYGRC